MSYNYFGKKILIVGIGLTGISCINFFLKKGITTKIIDESTSPVLLKKIPKNIQYKLGKLEHKWILESDLIIISPGVSSFKNIFIKARFLGIEIISDIELFAREAQLPIISITGTNGKSTVCKMVEKIAKKSGYNAVLGGNIGFPVLEMLNKKADFYIIELSSFQLESTFNLKSKISVVLNISEDHLDRYPHGYLQYKKIKISIYKKSEICIINSNEKLKNEKILKSKKTISFGKKQSEYYISYSKKYPILYHKKNQIMDTQQTKITGHHNYMNALVSVIISDKMNFPRKTIIDVLKNFASLPHRFQHVHYRNGVSWINDSKSTNVKSTQVALNSLRINGTIWLLLGGDSKSSNFSILKKSFDELKIKIYCFGKDGMKLTKICKKKSIYTQTLKEAIILIFKQVLPGDTVLLSPGCSSLDQFTSFEERGNLFTKLAKEMH